MKEEKFQPLTQDEMGKLYGGFTISPISDVTTYLNNKNGNCGNGGNGDTNANCSCAACDASVVPPIVLPPVTPTPPDEPAK